MLVAFNNVTQQRQKLNAIKNTIKCVLLENNVFYWRKNK